MKGKVASVLGNTGGIQAEMGEIVRLGLRGLCHSDTDSW